ncbi:hypothetical protein [Salinarimonas soli]|uniref:Uncharacterized protein n=1 Tax=Salinarimonas soli TaxID=1638099 RepID=A0A5B2VU90_9HYPH|nr:hypothetical protein [Salinarimonas soli]KAA2242354.1 hypothetical protein F0L46_03465 [Salinarimonas soli]
MRTFRRPTLITLLALLAFTPARAENLAVDVQNRSEPVLCAEKDNVTLTFASPQARAFRVEAAHPAYIGILREDRFAPDFTACGTELTPATTEVKPPRRVTFYEDVETWLTGYTFANFWRPNDVPFRVGDRVERGLHVVQLWVRRNERAEEVLVIYPGDGYWRLRPLPPAYLGWSAYGSSVLIGPVEDAGRPVVNLASIDFDPAAKAFRLRFARGGGATIRIGALDRDRLALDVAFDEPVGDRPFAALRSMYVTEFNADVARIAAREPGAPGWREEPVMAYRGGKATDLWTGRLVPSRHNTSAPDILFGRFGADGAPR